MRFKFLLFFGFLVIWFFIYLPGLSTLHASLDEREDRATEPQPASEQQMRWWRDAKFGLFIHWGPASLSGAEISWGRMDRIEGGQEHQRVPADVYDTLYKQFNPVQFDADAWMRLAKEAGCQYVVFITKHHDGFSMWPTKQVRFTEPDKPAHYSIADSPYQRDLCRAIADAAHRHGLKLGWYYSTRDWTHPAYLQDDNQVYNAYYEAQIKELLTAYGTVDILWFDHAFGDWSQYTIENLFKMIYELQPRILVNNRAARGLKNIPSGPVHKLVEGDYDTPEQRIGAFQHGRAWETCITMTECPDGGGWSYRPDGRTRSLKECLQILIRTVTGDGNLLLNVGPLPTGEILPEQVENLKGMGQWLSRYGETLYGTRGGPWIGGTWGGSTYKDDTVYLHILEWPEEGLVLPPTGATIISSQVRTGGSAQVNQTTDGVTVHMESGERDPIDTIIELTMQSLVTEIQQP